MEASRDRWDKRRSPLLSHCPARGETTRVFVEVDPGGIAAYDTIIVILYRSRRLSRLFVTLVFLGVGSLPRLALCVGPEHWAIELADSACCRPISANGTMILGQDGGSCAGDCVDTALGVGVATPARDHAHQIVPAHVLALAPPVNVPVLHLGSCRIHPRPPRAAELSPRYLLTTVNLC